MWPRFGVNTDRGRSHPFRTRDVVWYGLEVLAKPIPCCPNPTYPEILALPHRGPPSIVLPGGFAGSGRGMSILGTFMLVIE